MVARALALASLLVFIWIAPAEARHHHRHHYQSHSAETSTGLGYRPRAWCGWYMRGQVNSDPGPQYNLARNWAHWGSASVAQIGAVVVWAHHVGKIVGHTATGWIINSGNDGHAVRTRERSIANAIAFRI